MPAKMFYEKDATEALKNKRVAVIGYGAAGSRSRTEHEGLGP